MAFLKVVSELIGCFPYNLNKLHCSVIPEVSFSDSFQWTLTVKLHKPLYGILYMVKTHIWSRRSGSLSSSLIDMDFLSFNFLFHTRIECASFHKVYLDAK